MCGFDFKQENNPACIACLTDPDHARFKECRNIYGNIEPLQKLNCTLHYYKSKGETPPINIEQSLIIIGKLDKYFQIHNVIPKKVYKIPFTLVIGKESGLLNIDAATQKYRIEILSLLDHIQNY